MSGRKGSRAASQPRRGLDHDEAANYVGVSFAAFDRLVAEGRMPRPIDLAGERVWDLAQLDRAFDRLSGLGRSSAD